MRLALLLCLAVVACSSDPAPPVDAGGADSGGTVDVGTDTGAVLDVPVVDVGEDRPGVVDLGADLGTDAGAGDVGVDAGSDAGAADVPADVACNADAGLFACEGVCRNLIRDSMNCGRCGEACAGAATCMAAQCIDLQTDPRNCGGLGQQCRAPNGTAGCAAGACTVGSCTAPFANCDGNVANGCEVDTLNTSAHCGGCNRPCGTGQSCREGVCR